MSFKCSVCGKKTLSGRTISHSHRATLRKFAPNLQKIRIKQNNSVSKEYVCTKCIKSNKITKA